MMWTVVAPQTGALEIKTPMTSRPTGQDRLIARLSAIAVLNEDDILALEALPMTTRKFAAGQDIVREAERTSESCVLIDGFLQRHKDLPEGRRQIIAFHVPGDMPDLQSLHLPLMDHTLSAVIGSTIATIQHSAIDAMTAKSPGIRHALWRESLIDAARFREWIANLGGRSAVPRLAHLLCELYVRNRAVGQAMAGSYFMPLTQARLGEALGLSVVHVNRTMSTLRERGLIALASRQVHILDWDGLRQIAEFDPLYLHLRSPI